MPKANNCEPENIDNIEAKSKTSNRLPTKNQLNTTYKKITIPNEAILNPMNVDILRGFVE